MSKLPIKDLKMNTGLEGISVSGIIEKVFERKNLDGTYGEYTEQDLIVSDGDTANDKIRFRLRDHKEVSADAVGMEITCQSKENKKQGKMMGVKVKSDSWTDKTSGEKKSEVRIIVTASAIVTIGEMPAEQEVLDDDGMPVPQKVKAPAPVKGKTPADTYHEAFAMAEEILTSERERITRLMALGYEEETIRTIATGIAIELNRRQAK